jgi:FKBP-type peptidyl-prolyl cis-trans isomerase
MKMKLKTLLNSVIVLILSLLWSCQNHSTNYLYEKPKDNSKENLIRANHYLVHKDSMAIAGYNQRHNWNLKCSSTGLWLEITQTTNNQKAEQGMMATISYRVEKLDGTFCYSSDSLGLKTFEIGHSEVESGLQQGVLLMRCGEKARLVLPPHLAWGLAGDGKRILPRETIVYQIELLKLERNAQ